MVNRTWSLDYSIAEISEDLHEALIDGCDEIVRHFGGTVQGASEVPTEEFYA